MVQMTDSSFPDSIEFAVTDEDIEHTLDEVSESDPISVAAREHFASLFGTVFVRIHIWDLRLKVAFPRIGISAQYNLDGVAGDFLDAYSRGDLYEVKPFTVKAYKSGVPYDYEG